MNKKFSFWAIGFSLLMSAGACSDLEHSVNGAKKKLLSENVLSLPVISIKTEKISIQVKTLVNDLYLPWAVTSLPSSDLLITEKNGAMYRFNPLTLERVSIQGLPESKLWGQGGLMDVIIHPNFATNRWIYFSYSFQDDSELVALRVARAELVDNSLKDVQTLFTAQPLVRRRGHFGGALTFGDDGYLYISSGERGERSKVQSLDNHLGKIIRLSDVGEVPSTNPFVNVVGARTEIYSLGHRNPPGLAIEPISRQLWSVEHGPSGGDEVNIIMSGENYGWPVVTYGVEYGTKIPIGEGHSKAGMKAPLYYYVPSIATSSMTFYQGDKFPEWQNNLLIGALSNQHINRLEVLGGKIVHQEKMLLSMKKRIRDIEVGLDGLIYALTDSGELLQISPQSN